MFALATVFMMWVVITVSTVLVMRLILSTPIVIRMSILRES